MAVCVKKVVVSCHNVKFRCYQNVKIGVSYLKLGMQDFLPLSRISEKCRLHEGIISLNSLPEGTPGS